MKAERCPEGFFHQSRTKAVHWLRRSGIVTQAFSSKRPSLEVACGYPLTAESLRSKTTEMPGDVTCWECAKLTGRKVQMP